MQRAGLRVRSQVIPVCLAVIVSGCVPASFCKSTHGDRKVRIDVSARASPKRLVEATVCDPQFTGRVSIETVDRDGDGLAEGLATDAEFTTTTECRCLIGGYLSKAGRRITVCARYHQMYETSNFRFAGSKGKHIAHIEFSGQEIFESGEDGPYDIRFTSLSSAPFDVSGLAVVADSMTVSTPAYSRDIFGEWTAGVASVVDRGVDFDADGLFEVLRVAVEVNVRRGQRLRVLGDLSSHEGSGEWHYLRVERDSVLTQGTHVVDLDFSGAAIRGLGCDGPFEVVVELGEPLPSYTNVAHETEPYRFTQFE